MSQNTTTAPIKALKEQVATSRPGGPGRQTAQGALDLISALADACKKAEPFCPVHVQDKIRSALAGIDRPV